MQYNVSLIICVFNDINNLKNIIEDALSQTLKSKEIIIVNDGSYDGSEEVLREYAKNYDEITLIEQKNEGISAARNKGLELARGEYVIFWDSDDRVKNTMLEMLYNRARADDADIVASQVSYNFLDSNVVRKANLNFPVNYISGIEAFDNVFYTVYQGFNKKNYVVGIVWDKLIRRELLIENNLRFLPVIYEDIVFVMQIFFNSNKVSFLNDYFYVNLQRRGSLSSTMDSLFYAFETLKIIKNFLAEKKILAEYQKKFEGFYLQFFFFITFKQIYTNLFSIKDKVLYAAYFERFTQVLDKIKEDESFREYYKNMSKYKNIQIFPRLMLKFWKLSSQLYIRISLFIYNFFL